MIPLLIMILGIMRDFQIFPVSKFIFVFVVLIALVIFNYENILYLLCFLIPLKNGIPGNYIFLLFALALLIKSPHINKKQIIFPSIIISYEVFLDVISPLSFNNVDLVSLCIRLFIVFFLIYDNVDKINMRKVSLSFAVGVVYLGFIVFFVSYKMVGINELFNGLRLGPTGRFFPKDSNLMLFTLNYNELGNFAAVGISFFIIIIYQLYCEEKRFVGTNQILCYMGVLFLFFCGLLTVSRTFLIVVFCEVLFVLFHNFKRKYLKILLGIMILFAILIKLFSFTKLGSTVLGRFVVNSELLTATGRTGLLKEYWGYQVSHISILLFGSGVVTYSTMHVNFSNAIHNMIQQVFFCYGLFGGLFFFYALLSPVLQMIKNKTKIAFPYFIPLFAILLFGQTIQILAPNNVLMIIPFCIWISEYELSQKGKEYSALT